MSRNSSPASKGEVFRRLALLMLLAPLAGAALAAPEGAAKPASALDPALHQGSALFAQNCAVCHLGGVPKAPHPNFFRMSSPKSIIEAMNNGVMKEQAAHLAADERRQIAEYLTNTSLADYKEPPAPIMCEGAAKNFDLRHPPQAVGWGYDTRRFVPARLAGLQKDQVKDLKLKWSFAFPEAIRARSQPVVAMGAVFVGSQDGTIYAFDLASGCARWTSRVSSEVRTAIVVEPWKAGARPPRNPRLYFGDLMGRVYAMDALTGNVLWRTRPDDHPNATITGTPALHGDTLYVPVSSLEVSLALKQDYACCTFRGSLVALDRKTGAKRWTHYTIPTAATEQGKNSVGTPIFGPSGAPVWGSPAVDARRGLIYHGSGENYQSPADGNSDALFAVEMKTGKRRWHYQLTAKDAWNSACMKPGHPGCPAEKGPDSDLSASPILIDVGGGRQVLVVASKSGTAWGFDPDAPGKPLWRTEVGRGSLQGGVHFGMAAEGTQVFVPIYDSKDTALGGTYSDAGFPGVHALDARTGKIVWRGPVDNRCNGRKDCEPGVSAAATATSGVVFAGHLDGWMRAYDSATGQVLWQTDTAQAFTTANGAVATGGSMSGPGPAISAGHLIVNSGYGFAYKMPGNALLVYSVDGK